jgi:hypothetical protein
LTETLFGRKWRSLPSDFADDVRLDPVGAAVVLAEDAVAGGER